MRAVEETGELFVSYEVHLWAMLKPGEPDLS